jgi:CheY-like chemotaxis protein
MPGISGHRVLRRLKGDGEDGTPVVVLSGSSNPQDRDAAISAGADSYVAKPASRESFIAEIAHALGETV